MSKKKCKIKWNRIVWFHMIIVLITVCIMGPGIVSAVDDGFIRNGDITEYLNVTSYRIMNKYESECTEFTEGDEIIIRAGFEINPLPESKSTGDTFYIKLPQSPYFEFSGSGTANDYLTYEIEDQKAVFTLTEAGAGQDSLVNGVFVVHGKAKAEGSGISGGGDGRYDDVGLVVFPNHNNSGNQSDDYNNEIPFPDESKVLRKSGKQWNGADVIAWSGLVNYWGLSSMFTNQTVMDKTNGVLIDHLEPGTTYREGTLYISVPCYISNLNGVMGERQIGEGRADGRPQDTNFSDIVIHDEAKNDTSLRTFQQLDPSGMTYEEFLTFIRLYPEQNNGQQVYGVYTHQDGTQTVMIAFGNLPGIHHYYKDLRKDFGGIYGKIDIFEAIDLDSTLTDGQKERMKLIYSQEGPSGGAITAYNFSFAVDVDTPAYGSGIYYNKMEFIYSENGKEEADTDTEFTTSYASIEGGFLSVKKKIDGAGAVQDSKLFYFIIEDDNGQIAAYGKTEEVIGEKGKESEVIFYKDAAYEHPVEKYDETSEDHWYNLLQPGKWYYLSEVDTPGYTAQVLDGRSHDPSNRFMYNKDIKNFWKFLVINYETEIISDKIDLTVQEIWKDDDNRDGKRPESVKVQLFANETPVSDEVIIFDDTNEWAHTWNDLDASDENGEIEYTAEGIDVPECYDTRSEKNQVDTIVLTNSYEPEKIVIEGEKKWNDNNNSAGERPDSIVVNLYGDGIKVAEQVVSAEMQWKYSFSGQLRYEKGREIVYVVQESPVENYSARYDGYNIENDYTPDRTSRTVRKIWKDEYNSFGRPKEIKVQMYCDGKEEGEQIILNESNKWEYTWTDLMDSQNGQKAEYVIKEVEVPSGYVASYNEDGTVILNTWKENKKKITANNIRPKGTAGSGTDASPAPGVKTVKSGDDTRWYILIVSFVTAGGYIYYRKKKHYKS